MDLDDIALHARDKNSKTASETIQHTLLRDRKKGWQKRAQRWLDGSKLMDALLSGPALNEHACTAWLDWGDDSLELISMHVPPHMTSDYAKKILGSLHDLVYRGSREKLGSDASEAGKAVRAGKVAAVLTDLLINAESSFDDVSDEDFWPRCLIKLVDDCNDGHLSDCDAHANIGRLLYRLSKNDSGRKFLIEDANLGFTKVGAMMYRSSSAGITANLILTLQNMLPEPTKGKGSPRTVALHSALKDQGWTTDVLKDSFFAIGRASKGMVPEQIMQCVNIFSKDSSRSRPQGFQITSLSVNAEDQLASTKSMRYLEQGNIICYLDSMGWRFSYYEDDEVGRAHSYPHVDIENFERTKGQDPNLRFMCRVSSSEVLRVEFSVRSGQTEALLKSAESFMAKPLDTHASSKESSKRSKQAQEDHAEQSDTSQHLPLKPVTPSTLRAKTYGSKGSGSRRASRATEKPAHDLTSESDQDEPAPRPPSKPASKAKAAAKSTAKNTAKSVPALKPTALKSRARYTLAGSIMDEKTLTPSSSRAVGKAKVEEGQDKSLGSVRAGTKSKAAKQTAKPAIAPPRTIDPAVLREAKETLMAAIASDSEHERSPEPMPWETAGRKSLSAQEKAAALEKGKEEREVGAEAGRRTRTAPVRVQSGLSEMEGQTNRSLEIRLAAKGKTATKPVVNPALQKTVVKRKSGVDTSDDAEDEEEENAPRTRKSRQSRPRVTEESEADEPPSSLPVPKSPPRRASRSTARASTSNKHIPESDSDDTAAPVPAPPPRKPTARQPATKPPAKAKHKPEPKHFEVHINPDALFDGLPGGVRPSHAKGPAGAPAKKMTAADHKLANELLFEGKPPKRAGIQLNRRGSLLHESDSPVGESDMDEDLREEDLEELERLYDEMDESEELRERSWKMEQEEKAQAKREAEKAQQAKGSKGKRPAPLSKPAAVGSPAKRWMQDVDVETSEMEEDEPVRQASRPPIKKHKQPPRPTTLKKNYPELLTDSAAGSRVASPSPSPPPAPANRGTAKSAVKRSRKSAVPQTSSQPEQAQEEETPLATSDPELDSSYEHSPKRTKMAGKTPAPKKGRSSAVQQRSTRGKGKGRADEEEQEKKDEEELTVPEMLNKIAPIMRKRVTRAQGRKA
ncbi:hypothetical protein IAT38_005487 [Cryptococcus sp. DSM 104549]